MAGQETPEHIKQAMREFGIDVEPEMVCFFQNKPVKEFFECECTPHKTLEIPFRYRETMFVAKFLCKGAKEFR